MIKPLPGYLLISPIEDESKTSGGLYLPEVSKDKSSKGRVISISPLVPFQGDFLLLQETTAAKEYQKIKIGSVVCHKKWTNQEISHGGKEYLLVAFSELLAVIEK